MENSRRGERRIYIYIHRAFYLICNSNRLAQRVLGRTCVFTRERERGGGGEGKGREEDESWRFHPSRGWERNLREVSIADIRANWFSFLPFLLISAPARLFAASRGLLSKPNLNFFFFNLLRFIRGQSMELWWNRLEVRNETTLLRAITLISQLLYYDLFNHPHRRTNCYKKT